MLSGLPRPRGRHGRRHARALVAATALAALALSAPSALAAPTAALRERLEAAGSTERIPVIATLTRQVDGTRYAGRPAALLRALRRTADVAQPGVADEVDGPVREFWLVNAIAFAGTPDEVRAVAADPAVESVDLDRPIRIADTPASLPAPLATSGGGGWGVGAVRAPAAWTTFGLRGTGVRVGVIDTGVDGAHADLRGRVIDWRDFVGASPVPMDDNGHGTHTAGTIAGGATGGGAIGVAPDAGLIVARAMGANGVGTGSALLAAAEWMTDPDGNPATADQPAVVSNSWASSGANDTWFRPMIRRWVELGIVPVFAAGNTGPGDGSVASPASYPEAVAVGALDAADSAPAFSSRGPVVWSDSDGLGPAAGTVLAKPDLAAPGVGIVSSVGTGWQSYSGTSMAAPHVAGIVALVRQANPSLSATAVADILRSSAVDVGAPGVDPASGHGRADAVRAIEAALGPAPDTRFSATPPALTNAAALRYQVVLSGGGVSVRTRVDGGAWSAPQDSLALTLPLAEGRHVVEAQALDAAGVADPSPARHVVTVDRTGPAVTIVWSRAGDRVVFRARARDRTGTRRGTLRWSFGDGDVARGTRVVRRFPEARAQRVVLTARDAAGNRGVATRAFRPPAAGAVRNVRVPGVVSRGRPVALTGRLVRPARVAVYLRPVRAGVQSVPATAPAERVGAPVARATARRPRVGAGFRVTLPLSGLRPGVYRLELRAAERTGGRVPPIVRRLTVT